MNFADLQGLGELLRRRVEVIADHGWRDRDAAGHLAELQRVSEEINAAGGRMKQDLPPRLSHFLSQCSYSKALEWIEAASAARGA